MGRLEEKFNKIFESYYRREIDLKTGRRTLLTEGWTGTTEILAELSDLQQILRPLYGKGMRVYPSCIGTHPDFKHLENTSQVVYCPITTLFMDMEGSTRLNFLFDLEQVRYIKNAFLSAAIAVVGAFDGHVHRMMGDAIMVFFGGIDKDEPNAVVDALNCASFLCHFAEESVRPHLNQLGFDGPLGIRIGVDYGPKDKVLWSSYGMHGVQETTATSFYVDVASKLQHAAGRNQIMVGQSLKEFLDLPENEIILKKTVQRNHEEEVEEFVRPNLTDRDGNRINYRQFVFDWEKYLEFSPLAQEDQFFMKKVVQPRSVRVKVLGSDELEYQSCSLVLPKHRILRFKPQLDFPVQMATPYRIKIKVENHGIEARKLGGENLGNHESEEYVLGSRTQYQKFIHTEHTAYRGLHYLIVEVRHGNDLRYKTKIGVYIN